MPRGFVSPSILFLNSWNASERAYGQMLLPLLGDRYPRYVEPCVGAFAQTMTSAAAGYRPLAMETSDVSLYSAIVGAYLSGSDLAELDLRLDGQPIPLTGDVLADASHLLWRQLTTRLEERRASRDGRPIRYYIDLVADCYERQAAHEAEIQRRLVEQHRTLGGLTFRARGIWEELEAAADDPQTVILANPPSYRGSYEKFYETHGRLTWAEPTYDLWDPKTDFARLVERMAEAPALLLFIVQTPNDAPGAPPPHPRPIYARDMGGARHNYWCSNRPDEVFALLGQRVRPRTVPSIAPLPQPTLSPEHHLGPDAQVEVIHITSGQAQFYKQLWVHRIRQGQASSNLAVLVDGRVAGVWGYDPLSVTRGIDQALNLSHQVLFVYGAGPWTAEHEGRLGRLVTMLAMSQRCVRLALSDIRAAGYTTMVTVQWTPHPEAKGLRGLMKLAKREEDEQAGYRLVYEAPLTSELPQEVYRRWLETESRYWSQRRPSTSEPA